MSFDNKTSSNSTAQQTRMGSIIRSRALQLIVLALIIVTTILLILVLAEAGVQTEAKWCAPSIWKAKFPKWIGCIMGQHEGLAGGLIAAGGALFAGWLAWSAVREQIDLERASNEPQVVAYLIPDRQHINILHLVVANVGRGAARDVSVEMDAEPADFAAHKIHIPPRTVRPVLSVLPQGERVHQFFGSVLDLLPEPPIKDFDIQVRFSDLHGKSRVNVCRASVSDFEGQRRAGTPPEYVIAEGIKKIADEIAQWGSGFKRLKVETITAEDEARRQEPE